MRFIKKKKNFKKIIFFINLFSHYIFENEKVQKDYIYLNRESSFYEGICKECKKELIKNSGEN
jgi:hypothetical protein